MQDRKRLLSFTLSVAVSCTLIAGCAEPELDCVFSDPTCEGTAPAPAGVISGTVQYRGPRPFCERDADGELIRPIEPRGAVVMILFLFDNPPPPDGSGSGSENLIALRAADLFPGLGESDCLPPSPTAEDLTVQLNRSMPFRWPDIRLRPDASVSYQLRAFFDHDADFIPFFTARNGPTRGDIVGGAFDMQGAFRSIDFAPRRDDPVTGGQLVGGISVTLAATVNTERPAFTIAGTTTPLSTEASFPITADSTEAERMLYGLANARLDLLVDPSDDVLAAFAAAGLEDFDRSPLAYSWFLLPVDVNRDGAADPHPVLGSSGIEWHYPVIFFQRQQTPEETAVGIPSVAMAPTVRPTALLLKEALRPSVQITVPPVGIVGLTPDPACRVLYAAPGNPTTIYESAPAVCAELPSGRFRANVIHGVAGGQPMTVPSIASEACVDGTCYRYAGGPSNQVWTLPNEIGVPEQIGGAAVPAVQGIEALFTVADPSPDEHRECTTALDPMTGMVREVTFMPIPDECCAAVAHLCGLPLCEAREIGPDAPDSVSLLESGRSTDHGAAVRILTGGDVEDDAPTCVPFAMPPQCCA